MTRKRSYRYDKVYALPQDEVYPFKFNEQVADSFPDMALRSIPGYHIIQHMTEMFTARFFQANSYYYDLGCSLGATTIAIARAIGKRNAKIIAIDNAPAMIQRARELASKGKLSANIDFICADIRDIRIKKAAVVAMNYTLQFIPPQQRQDLLTRIYRGLKPGGVLILSEKISFENSNEQDFQSSHYYAFKEFNGYSKLEISQKRTALDNVLIADTRATHLQRLNRAGFQTVHQWFQYFSFISILAVK